MTASSSKVGYESAGEPKAASKAIPTSSLTSATDVSALQTACIAALTATRGQDTAAHTIEDSTFAFIGDTLEIQTTLSKTMLPLGINAEAQRILQSALREHGAGNLNLKLLPGAPAAEKEKKPSRPAAAGSAAELAAKHPLVQQAQQLFGAEISNVIDLRDKT